MKRVILCLFFIFVPIASAQHSYSTSFPIVESPVSESGKWINGGSGASNAIGLDWTNINVTVAGRAIGTTPSTNAAQFSDSTAVLQGIGFTWGSNQTLSAKVYMNNPGTAYDPEIEIRLNTTIAAHSITGYECDFSAKTSGAYIQLVRWNGANGSFSTLAGPTTASPLTNGDIIACGNVNGKITAYKNNLTLISASDSTYTGGSPGIGTDTDGNGSNPGAGIPNGLFGIQSIEASDSAGVCPSGASYLNPANPTGTKVTLASLGITSCYFIAANGSNSNTGIDESHPWQFPPGMSSCTAICATVQNTSGGVPAGTGFIFRGGDTWHFGNSALSPYSAAVPACATNGTTDGAWCLSDKYFKASTTANPYYLGVDKAWFSGSSWARPIMTVDNPVCSASTVGTLPGGTTCTQITDQFNQPSWYVSGCPFHSGNQNYMVSASNAHMWILDNFEFTGLCGYQLTVGTFPTAQAPDADTFFRYGSATAPIVFENLYVHGTSHLKFAGAISTPSCNGPGVYCKELEIWHGSTASTPGEIIIFNVVDMSDSDAGIQMCFGGFYNVAYNYLNWVAGCLPNPLHVFHDNTYTNFFECGHCNLLESAGNDVGPISAIYNNRFAHVEQHITGGGGGVGLWPHPAPGNTTYLFNNIYYDIGQLEVFNMGGGGQNFGNETVFNNTIQSNGSQPIYRCENYQAGTVTIVNEHAITEGGTYLSSANCNGRLAAGNPLTSLFTNNSTANSAGYTSLTNPVYFPQSATAPTVNSGTNEVSGFCATLLASSDSLIQSAGTACLSDTSYGVTVDPTTHSVVFPGRTPVLRDPSASWDKGGFEFLAGGGAPPTLTPPTLVFGLTSQGTVAATQQATLLNNSTTLVTFTGGAGGASFSGTNASDFPQTNTCSTTLAINASCVYTVTFVPSASVGVNESATMSVSFTGPTGSPLSISLSGTSGQRPNVGPALLFYGETLSGCAPCPSNCLCFTRGPVPSIYQSNGGPYSYFWKLVVMP